MNGLLLAVLVFNYSNSDDIEIKTEYFSITSQFLSLKNLTDGTFETTPINNLIEKIGNKKDFLDLKRNLNLIKNSLLKINSLPKDDQNLLLDAIENHKKNHALSSNSGEEILKPLDAADKIIEDLLGSDDFLSYVINSESLGVHSYYHKDGTYKLELNKAIKKYSLVLGENNPELYRIYFHLWLDSERQGDYEACVKYATVVKNSMSLILPRNSARNLLHYGIQIKSLVKTGKMNEALSIYKSIPDVFFKKQSAEFCYHQFRLVTGLAEMFAADKKYDLVIKYQTIALECLVEVHGIKSDKVKSFAGLLRDNLVQLGRPMDATEIEKKYNIKSGM